MRCGETELLAFVGVVQAVIHRVVQQGEFAQEVSVLDGVDADVVEA